MQGAYALVENGKKERRFQITTKVAKSAASS